MTEKQRNFFFGTLWPKACRAQGWIGATDKEVKRRFVILQATTKLHAEVRGMKSPTDSMNACDQDQLTAVFNAVKLLADPLNLKKARAVENPAEAVAADQRERMLFKIHEAMKRGDYNYAYVQKIAAWNCREGQVADWQTLDAESLTTLLIHLNDRANAKDPDVHQTGPRRHKSKPDVVYQMKAARKFVPKTQLVTVPEGRPEDDDNIPY